MADLPDINLADVEFMKMDREFPADPDLSFHLFPDLPYELRLDIIEEWLRSRGDTYWTPGDLRIVRTCGTHRPRSRLRNPLQEYASINKEWKLAVEKHTFRSLTFVIPEFGRNTLLDDGESIYRPSALMDFDEPGTLDDSERICIGDRINAVLKISLSINIHSFGRRRTWPNLNTMFKVARAAQQGKLQNTDQWIVLKTKHAARIAFDKVIEVLERFQDSKLKSLSLDSGHDGLRMIAPMIPAHASLHLNQSLYAVTCRLEELRIYNVVNVPHFLKESWSAKETTPESPSAWPKLKFLEIYDYWDPDSEHLTSVAAELHDAVTAALPQMPNLILLSLAIVVPSLIIMNRNGDRNIPCRLQHTSVYIETCQQDNTSGTRLPEVHSFSRGPRQGQLLLTGPAPDPGTIDLWRQVAYKQWDCNLRVRGEYGGFTYWQGSYIQGGRAPQY